MKLPLAAALCVALAVVASMPLQASMIGSWIVGTRLHVPGAVYYDTSTYPESKVPSYGWPWPSGAMSKGTWTAWLKPVEPSPKGLQPYWSYFEAGPPTVGFVGSPLTLLSANPAPDYADTWWFASDSLFCDAVNKTTSNHCDVVHDASSSGGLLPTDAKWHFSCLSWDTTQEKFTMSVDGLNNPLIATYGTPSFTIDSDAVTYIDFLRTGVNRGIYLPYNGSVSEMWISIGTFLDCNSPATLSKFVTSSGYQAELGLHGEYPTGVPPTFYFNPPFVYDNWSCNNNGEGPYTYNVGHLFTPFVPGPNAVLLPGVPNADLPLPTFGPPPARDANGCN
jgi:hypothetical protein